jgi:4-aminobutyrate--pyruvate transaminase
MADGSSGRNATVGNLVLGFSNLRQAREERPLVVTGGNGIFVEDENGKQYIEASSSFYCAALGYSNERLIAAAERQMRQMPFYTSGIHRTVPVAMELADKLSQMAPMRDAHVAFGSTGSEANDFLIKFMRYRNVYRGEAERSKVISRRGGYHGGTCMTASLGGYKSLHDSFTLDMKDHIFVSQPNDFAEPSHGQSEEQLVESSAAEIEQAILKAGPETVGAFLAEPVCFSSGFHPPPAGYFQRIQEVLRKYDVMFFDDEVVTGYCRTGNMFGAETLGFTPDCMTLAKGMSAAYFPISAIVMSGEFYDPLVRHSDEQGLFAHAGTYSAHPVGAAVALEMIRIIEEDGLLAGVQERCATFAAQAETFRGHPMIADVRVLGLAGAIQLVSSDGEGGATKALAGPSKALAEAALERGLMLRVNGPNVILCPPLIITDAEIAELFSRLRDALGDVERAQAA